MTREELIAKCKIENPKMIQIVNGKEIELTGDAYEEACSNWADMRLEQIAFEEAKAEAQAQKQAILDRLGLTEEELRIVLGQGIIL